MLIGDKRWILNESSALEDDTTNGLCVLSAFVNWIIAQMLCFVIKKYLALFPVAQTKHPRITYRCILQITPKYFVGIYEEFPNKIRLQSLIS